MSLSGCRPAVVTSWSSRNRLPALGPRLTTSRAEPGGSASTAPACSSPGSSPGIPSSKAPGWKIDVASGEDGYSDRDSGAPHCAQKRASSGLSWPHRVQNTVVSPPSVGCWYVR
jgi:hypothetical protein